MKNMFDDIEIPTSTASDKNAEVIVNKDTLIISNNNSNTADLSKFNKFKMTAEKRKELAEMKYLIDGLFVENYHTYIFGPSGAGKTTL